METIAQFAIDKRIVRLLIKERIKCSRKNLGQHDFSIHPEEALDEQTARKFLSTIMPPRSTWVRPKHRTKFKQPDKKLDIKKINAQAIWLTIQRDKADQAHPHPYLERLDKYIHHIQSLLCSNNLSFHEPELIALHKSTKYVDGHRVITYRPLSVYTYLDDKIILAIASRYLTQKFNKYLHPNILSYRCARPFEEEKHCVTDFNDGIKLIGRFREQHNNDTIYASDCDIRKFYDTINHDVIRNCFKKMFTAFGISQEAESQLMVVLNAYLNSFNFTANVLRKSESAGFWKQAYHRHRPEPNDVCRFEWLSDADGAKCYGSVQAFNEAKPHIGVPQGGALSLMIADVVLNDVDQTAGLPDATDTNRLFIRFCDDMILLHTSETECQRLMQAYEQSLTEHKLVYHAFEDIPKYEDYPTATRDSFWHQKSHKPFLWGDGTGNSNRYVGFLGYEMSRDGEVRLRRSNEQKFDDKFRRFYYSVYRQVKKHNTRLAKVDTLIKRFEKSMTHLVESINYYEGLQLFDYSHKQIVRLDRHRREMLRRIKSRLKNKQRPIPSDYTRGEIKRICNSLEKYKKSENGFKIISVK